MKLILSIFIRELLELVGEAISNYFKWKKKAKENKREADEIVKIKDKKKSAARMRDFLS